MEKSHQRPTRREPCDAIDRVYGRRDFPPVAELRARLDTGEPWNTVAIDARVRGDYRPDVHGPFSFFFNESGFSEVVLRGRPLPLAAQNFALSPAGETFTLVYPEEHTTHAVNLYFADDLVRDVQAGREKVPDLDAGPAPLREADDPRPVLRPIDLSLASLLRAVRLNLDAGGMALEQAVIELLTAVLLRPADVARVPRVRPATQRELHRRLLETIDYLVAYSDRDLTLGKLARICGLSKFHFLRMFRASTGSTPARFLTAVRVERAKALLVRGDRTVTEVALEVGFSEHSSFTRAFTRREGLSPRAFRNARAGWKSGAPAA